MTLVQGGTALRGQATPRILRCNSLYSRHAHASTGIKGVSGEEAPQPWDWPAAGQIKFSPILRKHY